MVLSLAAPIGAGKTTVADFLAQHFNTKLLHEPTQENQILPLFYQDQKRYSFALQQYLLPKRVNDLVKAYDWESNQPHFIQAVSDRSLIEDIEIFAPQLHDSGMLSSVEFDIYQENAKMALDYLNLKKQRGFGYSTDLMIFLKPSFERTLAQIKKRGRPFEQFENNQPLIDYYRDIYNRYQKLYNNYQGRKIQITDYDITNKEGQQEFLRQLVGKAMLVGVPL
jgi:deoxyadenosine/deoxycytidine kinase